MATYRYEARDSDRNYINSGEVISADVVGAIAECTRLFKHHSAELSITIEVKPQVWVDFSVPKSLVDAALAEKDTVFSPTDYARTEMILRHLIALRELDGAVSQGYKNPKIVDAYGMNETITKFQQASMWYLAKTVYLSTLAADITRTERLARESLPATLAECSHWFVDGCDIYFSRLEIVIERATP